MDTYRIHLIWIHLRLPPFISQKAAGSVEGRFDSTVLQQRYSTGNSNSTVGLVIAVFSAAVLEFCMLVDETSSGSLKSDDAENPSDHQISCCPRASNSANLCQSCPDSVGRRHSD